MPNELDRLRAENEKLRIDLERQGDSMAGCESCGAQLYADDDFIGDGDVSGCWAGITEEPDAHKRPCYAYRVGKPDARAALSPKGGGDA